jgi:hypothetical protein
MLRGRQSSPAASGILALEALRVLARAAGITLWLLLAALACGCGRPSPPAAERRSALDFDPIPHAREADDIARFLDGLPGRAGSPFAELESGTVWKEHSRLCDAAWAKAEAGIITGLRAFAQQELAPTWSREEPVFYPFGGPDAMTPILCLPHSPLYVLVGLEPPGTLPTAEEIRDKDLAAFLAAVREAMASELGRSFFITREMDNEFRGQVTDGLLLPIIQLLARTGHAILGFRYVRLDEQGRVVERQTAYRAPGAIGNKGVEIEFRAEADQSIHRLCYFSVNLADSRLRGNQPFLSYAARLKGSATLLKATSYMIHRDDFSMVRDLLLANSAMVLQDDSGIPYRCFARGQWRLRLYGSYKRPYGSFRWIEQPDLVKAYEGPDVRPLPVSIGYGYRRIPSNLLLAQRPSPSR